MKKILIFLFLITNVFAIENTAQPTGGNTNCTKMDSSKNCKINYQIWCATDGLFYNTEIIHITGENKFTSTLKSPVKCDVGVNNTYFQVHAQVTNFKSQSYADFYVLIQDEFGNVLFRSIPTQVSSFYKPY